MNICTQQIIRPILLACLVVFTLLAATGAAGEAALSISSIEELQLIGNHPDYPLDGDYFLTQDIDASPTQTWNGGLGFVPIGSSDAGNSITPFTGTFDGQGHVITGLYINRPDEDDVGLFSVVENGGEVRNVGLEGGAVTGGQEIGGLVGWSLGTISASYVTGDVSGDEYVGGLMGGNGGTVSASYATGTVSGNDNAGGLMGYNGGTVSESHATGGASGANDVGGLVGRIGWNGGTVSASYATGDVSGDDFVGGLVGSIDGDNGTVSASYATGDVTGGDYVGGLVGWMGASYSTVSASYATGAITGSEYVGGLVGWSYGKVSASHATGDVSGDDWIAGLVGTNEGTVLQAYATGVVTARHFWDAGGLVGYNGGTVSMSYASGAVLGVLFAGGLVGLNDGSIEASYATGNVTGISAVGGLVGSNYGTVSEAYATGAVSGSGHVGGLVGAIEESGTVSASFWDMDTSGQSASQGGVGLSTGEMMEGTILVIAGWDFDLMWDILAGESYPWLRSLAPAAAAYTLDILADNGLVSATPALEAYPPWSLVWLEAVPASGYVFVDWTGQGRIAHVWEQQNPLPLVVGQDYTIRALFLPDGPIEISSIEELQKIGNDPAYPLQWDYALTQDIDASATENWNHGTGFDPIGAWETNSIGKFLAFTGIFYGQGHIITNLYINRPNESEAGLFGAIGAGGQVSNTRLEGGNVLGRNHVGGLVGKNAGSVSASYATGAVSGEDYVGGLVGWNEGTVTESYATGVVSGEDYVGGLVGSNKETVTESYATGAVSGYKDIGGLLGWSAGTVTDAYAMGAVSGEEEVGGLVGRQFQGIIWKTYAAGAVSGSVNVGGLVGRSNGTVASFWDMDTTGQLVSDGGSGLSTRQMLKRSTFEGAGWNFEAVWEIVEGVNYPFLLNLAPDNPPTPGEGEPASQHSADQNGDGQINQTELLRAIQFFNSGGYYCAEDPEDTEDGYVPGPGADHTCIPHSSDYKPDGPNWQIDLAEVLRLIQFFNSGGYHHCPDADPATEDGYCPGVG